MKRIVTATAFALALGAGSDAFAQAMVCGAPANCTNSGMTRVCTEMWVYSLNNTMLSMGYVNTVALATGAATSCTVMGNLTTRTFQAQQPTFLTSAGGCYFAGIIDTGGGTNLPYACRIDQASGLPVELLEFSVEEEEPEGTEPRDDDDAAE
jgi:hypothetical protein